MEEGDIMDITIFDILLLITFIITSILFMIKITTLFFKSIEKKISITEEMNLQKDWYNESNNVTLDKLPMFLNKLLSYNHDYGTIVHALVAGALGTIRAMDKTEQGGITGFQASCLMWEFIRNWNHNDNKTGMKLLDYDKMLYPQYHNQFDKIINENTWFAIQKQAFLNLDDAYEKIDKYETDLEIYKLSIKNFVDKYPDYYTRQEYYTEKGFMTKFERNYENEQIKSGFEFAPYEPHFPIHEEVVKHWESIVNDIIPFGYDVEWKYN